MEDWPREACGLFVTTPEGLAYKRVANVHPEPEDYFQIADHVMAEHMEDQSLQGVFHSHPHGELTPSVMDQQTQRAVGVPFYVCTLSSKGSYMDFWGWGDELPVAPLKHRDFRDGVHDCFSLYRDYKWMTEGVVVPTYHREQEWWDKDGAENPFEAFLHRSGHTEVAQDEIMPGDGITFTLPGRSISHCGVYIGQGLFLHHLHGKISKTDPLVMWRKFIHKVVRYTGDA